MAKFSKNKLTIAGLAAVTILGSAGAALAYLTDSETADNVFTMGDVSIESLEPNWPGNDSTTVKDIVPNKEIAKDPQVDNKGTNDAIVFITVDSPMEKITVVGDNGAVVTEKSVNELFWFKDAADAASTHANNFDAGWQELTAKEMYVKIAGDGTETKIEAANLATTYDAMAATDTLVKRYVFGYKQAIQGSTANDGTAQTAENKKTTPLFDKVQLKNVLENEVDKAGEKLVVRSYAIQASQIFEDSTDIAATLNETNLGKIYDVFVRQNSTGNDVTGLKVNGLRDIDSVTPTQDGADGTTTSHTNRWDTNADVSSPNNKKPS